MWFGKKKIISDKKESLVSGRITTIPDDFYGGLDPIIYHETKNNIVESKRPNFFSKFFVKTESAPKVVKSAEQVKITEEVKKVSVAENKPSVSAERKLNLFTRKKIFAYSAVLILTIGLLTWYYAFYSTKKPGQVTVNTFEKNDSVQINNTETDNQNVNNNPIENSVNPTSTEIAIPNNAISSSLGEANLEFPATLLVDSNDLDSDNLTDLEEELMGTDSGKSDTDSDGYYDGQEVLNLYNPKGEAPVKIIDSGLVSEYLNPIWRYRLYYPLSWEQGNVDEKYTEVLFSAITGDYVEVRVFEKPLIQSFEEWFSSHAKGQNFSDLKPFANRFKLNGYIRFDELVTYFPTTNVVYVFVYHKGTTENISYRRMMRMMANSFRIASVNIDIPDQAVLPKVPVIVPENGTAASSTETIF